MALPYKTNLAVAKLAEFPITKLGDAFRAEVYLTLRWPVQAAKQVQQRLFTGSGLPHESHPFSTPDVEIQVAKHDDLALARAKGLGQIDGTDRTVLPTCHFYFRLTRVCNSRGTLST